MDIRHYDITIDDEITFYGNQIIELEGFNDFGERYSTIASSTGDGVQIIGSSAEPREMKIACSIKKADGDSLVRYFKKGTLHELKIGKRKIKFVVENRELNYQEFGYFNNPILILIMFAPNPYFIDIDNFGQNLAGIQPQFGFPWRATKQKGITMGYRVFSDSTIFFNKGDKEVGMKVVFKATRGDATNISIKNLKTGKFTKINNLMMEQGDEVIISSISGDKYISHNDINIYGQIDRLSEFLYLDVGDNYLQFDAETGKTNIDVYLYYSPLYSNGMVVD